MRKALPITVLATIILLAPHAAECQSGFEDLLAGINRFTNADTSAIEQIYSLARCSGPEGAYSTEVVSTGGYLLFKQLYRYRPDTVLYIIDGDKTCNIAGEPLSRFEQFLAESHDFIRAAVQPGFMIRFVDNISHGADTTRIFGTTYDSHAITYRVETDSNRPLGYLLQITGTEDPIEPIVVEFSGWVSPNRIRYPAMTVIRQGEETFLFNYESVLFNSIDMKKTGCHDL